MKMRELLSFALVIGVALLNSCGGGSGQENISAKQIGLVVLDPAHPHAASVQRTMYSGIDSIVHVYAPAGLGLTEYLHYIKRYNAKTENPTHWVEKVYTGNDYLQKAMSEKAGNVVVLAGNNLKKAQYIKQAIDAGMNVLADKPMIIDGSEFDLLKDAFETAEDKGLVLYDIMPERSLIISILQRELAAMPSVFGKMEKGSVDSPAVVTRSEHRYFKHITRPDWFFDPLQQGGALVDVGTHLIDLVQWICFPEVVLDYEKDIKIQSCRIWPTVLTLTQFSNITKEDRFPNFLQGYVKDDSLLLTHGNGVINYTVRGMHVRVTTLWTYDAPKGQGDSYYVLLKGTKAYLERRQGEAETYRSTLYIWPNQEAKKEKGYASNLEMAIKKINEKYPGVSIVPYREKSGRDGWKVVYNGNHTIPPDPIQCYLDYVKKGELPKWEAAGIITKYYITTKALEMASELNSK